ncbi:hypothetical protein BKA70DRAFT_1342180 [Coprinopsis sp. MPI-PUGE-AT-0042]|nr:hypothetical protein BKA70DRAFT_1342180 [Coprinopsis sp. MPI-PUGE-AT-0042]
MTTQDSYSPVLRTARYASLPSPRSSRFTASNIQMGGSSKPRYRPLRLRRSVRPRSARSTAKTLYHANPILEPPFTAQLQYLGGHWNARRLPPWLQYANPGTGMFLTFCSLWERHGSRWNLGQRAHMSTDEGAGPTSNLRGVDMLVHKVYNPAQESLAPYAGYFIPPALSAGPTLHDTRTLPANDHHHHRHHQATSTQDHQWYPSTSLPLFSCMTPWALGGLSGPIVVIMFDTWDCIGSNIQFLATQSDPSRR